MSTVARLEIYDENQNVLFSSSFDTTFILGTAHADTTDGYIEDDGLTGKTPWVAIKSYDSAGSYNRPYIMPMFTLDGNRLSWTWSDPMWSARLTLSGFTFYYGVV